MNVRQSLNFARLSALLVQFIAHTSAKREIIRDPRGRQNFYVQNCSNYSRQFLKILNAEVVVNGLNRKLFEDKNYLFVSNHMSFLEVLAISAAVPSIFITSVDMGETKLIGTLAELVGSIFVERRNRKKIALDIEKIKNTLKEGYNVVIYPEGTTSDGVAVMPFKKSLLNSAIEAGRDVWPVCVRYLEYDKELFSVQNHDKMCWYGDITFMQLMLNLLASKSTKIELNFLKPIAVTLKSDRHEVAEQAYRMISECYGTPLNP